jgi:hypothetical protein
MAKPTHHATRDMRSRPHPSGGRDRFLSRFSFQLQTLAWAPTANPMWSYSTWGCPGKSAVIPLKTIITLTTPSSARPSTWFATSAQTGRIRRLRRFAQRGLASQHFRNSARNVQRLKDFGHGGNKEGAADDVTRGGGTVVLGYHTDP